MLFLYFWKYIVSEDFPIHLVAKDMQENSDEGSGYITCTLVHVNIKYIIMSRNDVANT